MATYNESESVFDADFKDLAELSELLPELVHFNVVGKTANVNLWVPG